MKRIFALLIVLCATFVVALPAASAVTIDWSPVGNPGNAADPATGSLYGSVGYDYNIGTYDVTNSQYVEFLNSNDPTGASPLELYNSNMSNATYGGINYNSGAASGSKYSVISGKGDNPVNYVTFYDTLRFRQLARQRADPWQHRDGGLHLARRDAHADERQHDHAGSRRDRVSAQRERVVQGRVLQSEHEFVLSVWERQQHGSHRDQPDGDAQFGQLQ